MYTNSQQICIQKVNRSEYKASTEVLTFCIHCGRSQESGARIQNGEGNRVLLTVLNSMRWCWALAAVVLAAGSTPPPQDAIADRDLLTKKLIRDLGSDDHAVRERAHQGLAAMGRSVIPHMQEACARTQDREVQARLELLLNELLRVRATLAIEPNVISVDVPAGVFVSVRLINGLCDPVVLAKAKYGSPVRWRYPYAAFEIIDPDGIEVPPRRWMSHYFRQTHRKGELFVSDLVEVASLESFDPFSIGGSAEMNILRWWRPDKPGKYRLRFVYDSTCKTPRDYSGVQLSREARLRFERLHHNRMVSPWVVVEVR